ncbi:MAG: cation transporter [Oscillospiraceae bacterium]|nr:cation transporter [Oscillospiraceae bacterium]
MTKLLIKLFVKNSDRPDDPNVRARYGMLSGIVGIICNILLTVAKFIVGTVTGSIAITADAANNLSDAGSSAVTLFSFKLANKPADEEHPFGHGRIEYISAMAVAFLVLMMGVELIRSSVDKIINPEPIAFSAGALIVLILSIGAKIWLALFNRSIGKRINSPAVGAVMMDSLSDTAATAVSMIALILSKFTAIPLDGYMGIIVALFIVYTGISIFKDTLGVLLGKSPDPELVRNLEKEILSYDGVVGVHDLIVHDYGPSRVFASAHAEVSASDDIMTSHDTIDRIERDIKLKYKIEIVIHLDPIVVDDERVNEMRMKLAHIVKQVDPSFTMHDFRMVDGPTHTNLIFDLVIPHKCKLKKMEIFDLINSRVRELGDNYYTVITIEHSFVEQTGLEK